ncbi:MAG: hypothetical protein KAH38_08535, partial [Candidatus Hydrogenedentes bacterium]|nr:hypothetical protein [Candidatus Hydrogenedentota bacterium]
PVSSKSDKVSAAAQPEQNSEPHWEYDTEGKMVVRVEEKDAALEPPAVPASKKKDVVKVEDRQKTNSSGQIATFWFLMPRS